MRLETGISPNHEQSYRCVGGWPVVEGAVVEGAVMGVFLLPFRERRRLPVLLDGAVVVLGVMPGPVAGAVGTAPGAGVSGIVPGAGMDPGEDGVVVGVPGIVPGAVEGMPGAPGTVPGVVWVGAPGEVGTGVAV